MAEIKPTTALRKISSLSAKIWGIQGGQGAGKTFSILMILINHASGISNRQIYVVSAELSKMRDTVIKDFLIIIRAFGLNPKLTGMENGPPKAVFPNGSFIRFIGLDKEDVGKGLRSDVVFVNEANKINFETYRELTSRAKRVIIDFNPNANFWFHDEVQHREDCDFLVLTFPDNEFLSEEERNEILSYKEKGYDKDGNVISEYWANKWRIYGLGEVGGVEGRIYHWASIPNKKYEELPYRPTYYADWGTVDPFAIGEVKYHDGQLWTKDLNYRSENEWAARLSETEKKQFRGKGADGFVVWLFTKLGIPKDHYVICDNSRPDTIKALRRAGWAYVVAIRKEKIIEGIDLLQSLDNYYTESSKDTEQEQRTYKWATDRKGTTLEKPEDLNNHHMDGRRYAATWLRQQGIINRV